VVSDAKAAPDNVAAVVTARERIKVCIFMT
jgi:hypothetical protein